LNYFPPIGHYAFLSDCENNCLIAPDGSVEWLCLPRPDSESVFGAILDRSAGGFRFGPAYTHVPLHRSYIPGTMVLETTWHTPSGWLLVQDFMAVGEVDREVRRSDYLLAPGDSAAVGTLVRTATCIGGTVDVVTSCQPVFEYGATGAGWSYNGEGYGATTVQSPSGDITLELTSSLRLGEIGALCYGRTTLSAGQSAFVTLSWAGHSDKTKEDVDRDLMATVAYWRDWISAGRFPDHPWRTYLERSALTLKGLSYSPTGAIMAAATTSLPETPGGTRNWDYRFTWIRDSAFMLRSLYRLGFAWEALEYFAFVVRAVIGSSPGGLAAEKWELQIMYGITGERELTERTLDHLRGYRGSQPVRVGNGAWNQHQNDVWGMLLDAVDTQVKQGISRLLDPVWKGLASLVDQAIELQDKPDQGIWEIRGDPQHFTASKVLCWVAATRGADMAREREETECARRWQEAADKMKADILNRGVDERGRFRQHYDNDELDASLLLIPIMGFLPPDDERVKATVLAIADELTENDLVLRYKVETTDTGFEGKEGTFTICSFWLVSALAMIGELDRAHALCSKLLSFAGPLELYAEEIDTSTGEHLGNFPQAFTHLALIDAVSRLIDAEQGEHVERQSLF
jgi:alpha,alpha-trehalase